MAYASVHGHALIDRELYLPQSWAEDPQRCRTAGIPEEVEFVTKPRQAQAMIARRSPPGYRLPGSPRTRPTAGPSGCRPGWKTRTCPM